MLAEAAFTPKRIVPNPGIATECPSVAHVWITEPIASQAAFNTPRLMFERTAASWITFEALSLL